MNFRIYKLRPCVDLSVGGLKRLETFKSFIDFDNAVFGGRLLLGGKNLGNGALGLNLASALLAVSDNSARCLCRNDLLVADYVCVCRNFIVKFIREGKFGGDIFA